MKDVRLLADVPEQNKFYLSNGKVLRNLKELALEFEEMDYHTFYHHVNEERNDFRNWIYATIGDKVLANAIAEVKQKSPMQKEISDRVLELEQMYKSSKGKGGGKKGKKK